MKKATNKPSDPTKFELTWPVDKLVHCPWNPRKISAEQRAALVQSIRRSGQVQALVVNKRDMMVLGGNQRLDALREAGIKTTPVVFVDLDDRDSRALNLALNRIAGEWDYPQLENILRSLGKEESVSIGFSESEYKALVAAMEAAGPKLLDLDGAEQEALNAGAAPPLTWEVSTAEVVRCPKCGHEDKLSKFLKQELETDKKGAKSHAPKAHAG